MKSQAIAAEVQTMMVQVRHQVAARLHKMFQESAMIAAIGQDRADRLKEHTALGGATLGWVSAEISEAAIERRPENKLGRYALRHVIDALGFLADCEEGRWQYFTDDKRRVSLQWASEELDQLDEALKQAQGEHGQAALSEETAKA